MSFVVFPAGPSDAEELARVHVTSWRETYRGLLPDAFLARMSEKLGDSVFALGSCSTANSYYFNQHGEATLLRPTTTVNAFREAGSFPLDAYAYA